MPPLVSLPPDALYYEYKPNHINILSIRTINMALYVYNKWGELCICCRKKPYFEFPCSSNMSWVNIACHHLASDLNNFCFPFIAAILSFSRYNFNTYLIILKVWTGRYFYPSITHVIGVANWSLTLLNSFNRLYLHKYQWLFFYWQHNKWLFNAIYTVANALDGPV